jgi:hypothetical protein
LCPPVAGLQTPQAQRWLAAQHTPWPGSQQVWPFAQQMELPFLVPQGWQQVGRPPSVRQTWPGGQQALPQVTLSGAQAQTPLLQTRPCVQHVLPQHWVPGGQQKPVRGLQQVRPSAQQVFPQHTFPLGQQATKSVHLGGSPSQILVWQQALESRQH